MPLPRAFASISPFHVWICVQAHTCTPALPHVQVLVKELPLAVTLLRVKQHPTAFLAPSNPLDLSRSFGPRLRFRRSQRSSRAALHTRGPEIGSWQVCEDTEPAWRGGLAWEVAPAASSSSLCPFAGMKPPRVTLEE